LIFKSSFIIDGAAIKKSMGYDHRRHTGNAGDLWKHLVLAEVAGQLFDAGIKVYVESHAGYPEYRLSPGGDWEGGIGRIWPHREKMAQYPYFRILDDLNPDGLERYPGSSSIVLGLARKRGFNLRAELWDLSPEVERAWRSLENGWWPGKTHFHRGDGFSGVHKLTDELDEPALLFIDSPYIAEGDASLVEDLISRSAAAGWVALSWQMIGLEKSPRPACDFREFALFFEDAGLVCGPWKGATMTLSWGETAFLGREVDDLIERLGRIEEDFPKIAVPVSESF
jgi:hypothetical protein